MAARTPDEPTAPPHNLDVERAVLGTVLLDPKAFVALQDRVAETDFHSGAHRQIYHAMRALADRSQPIDPTTLAEALRQRGDLEAAGGPAYLATLESYVFTSENLAQYTEQLLDLSRRRRLIEASETIRKEAFSSPRSVGEILDESEKRIFALTQEGERREFLHVSDVAFEAMDEAHARFHNRQEVAGLSTGFPRLDEKLTGLHPSELIILAARPSVGKTALALNIATHVALRESKPTAIFSLEMSAPQIVQRILCSMARIPMQKMRTGSLHRADLGQMDEQARRLSVAPLYIDDSPSLSVLEVRAKARRLGAQVRDLGFLVIDYLQLMRGHGRVESRQQEVAEIARSLKALAREMSLPILALSQLSRGIEQRKGRDKTPKLSDLRESGAIEQDA
ncbi:MAG: replicative DNA helicase, partial [Candidatus Sumerlaeota bacterium]|nr:replicative DNA helicase [Candidatus Sumerlaeota bacterium]